MSDAKPVSPAPAAAGGVLQLSYEGAASASAAAVPSTAATSLAATAANPGSSPPPSLSPSDLASFDALLSAQGVCGVRDFFLRKFESDAVRNWDVFYKRNADRFYKDRHYLTAEFAELGALAAEARRERGEAEPAQTTNTAEEEEADEGLPSASPPAAAAASSSAAAAAAAAPLLPIRLPTLFASPSQPRLLEVGCGVGNAFFPLLDILPSLFVYALDCSKNAIQVVQNHRKYREQYESADAEGKQAGATGQAEAANAAATDNSAAATAAADNSAAAASTPASSAASAARTGRCAAWVCDLVCDDFPAVVRSAHVDYATLVFVLSAIHPDRMGGVLRKVCAALKPGGVLFLRDYCHYDLAQLRFAPSSKLGLQWYVRQDGTRSYFFHLAEIERMLEQAGFEIMEAKVVCKRVMNRKEQSEMKRRFVQVRARARPRTDSSVAAVADVAAAGSSDPATVSAPIVAASNASSGAPA